MKVFISWSGPIGQSVAQVLNRVIPRFFRVETFCSADDLGKGVNWEEEISKALRECHFSLVIITPESLPSHWVTYEAGALWSRYEAAHVCPILVGVRAEDCPRPLTKFQLTICDPNQREKIKDEFERLLMTIAASVEVPTLTRDGVVAVFAAAWPELKRAISTALSRVEDHKKQVIVDEHHSALRSEINGLEEQLGMLGTSVSSPAYFMDQNYSIIYSNLAAHLVFGLTAGRSNPMEINAFLAQVKPNIENWSEVEANLQERFLKAAVPPKSDFETVIYRHSEYGRMLLKKVGLAVFVQPDASGAAPEKPMGWVVTFNVSEIEKAACYYAKLHDQVLGVLFGRGSSRPPQLRPEGQNRRRPASIVPAGSRRKDRSVAS